MNQKVALGRIVHVFVDPRSNNGSDVCPAIITRVWQDGETNPFGSVNWRLILDHASNDAATQEWRTSTMVFDDREDAENHLQHQAEQIGDDESAQKARMVAMKAAGTVGYFPPRL